MVKRTKKSWMDEFTDYSYNAHGRKPTKTEMDRFIDDVRKTAFHHDNPWIKKKR